MRHLILALAIFSMLFFANQSYPASLVSKDVSERVIVDPVGSAFALKPEISNRKPIGTAVKDYSVTPAPTGSALAVLTVADDFKMLDVFDSSGAVLTMSLIYPFGGGTYVFSIAPGGPGLTPIGGPSGTAITIVSAGATAVTGGQLIVNAYK